jgi:hypothetical protein
MNATPENDCFTSFITGIQKALIQSKLLKFDEVDIESTELTFLSN